MDKPGKKLTRQMPKAWRLLTNGDCSPLSTWCGFVWMRQLQRATDTFIERVSRVERLAAERNVDMRTCGLDVLDALWDEAKAAEVAKQS